MAASFLVTLAYWLFLGASALVLAQGMALPTSFLALVVTVVVVTFLSTSLPSLPGALGTFEFATTYMLGFYGVEHAQALSYAVLLHGLLYLPPVAVALLLLPRESIAAFHRRRESRPTSGEPRPPGVQPRA
jgi:uncharacterized membrane protein YbhN (UPF0104 family)